MKFYYCEVCGKKFPKDLIYHPMDIKTQKIDKSRARCVDCLEAAPEIRKIEIKTKI